VILAVTQAVDRWEPDGKDASFRRWLFAIARRLALKFVQRGRAPHRAAGRGTGGSDMLQLLDSLPEPDARTSSQFDDEYRTELICWAAERVRSEFRETTWQAFWRTCVLHESIADVAELLGVSAGSVYVSRSRIIGRIRQIVEEFEVNRESL
jgi:RNA polymerase sigma-70 factor (ECF subfamily)